MKLRTILVALAAFLTPGSPAAETQKPNILLIVSDDQGFPDLGSIGSKPLLTPNLDKLAAEGVRGTNFYVTWPACTPSRGSILTGRYPQRNGLYDMVRNDMINYGHKYTAEEYAVSPEMTLGLDPREKTLGDLLKSAGYRTGMVGKWDMGQAKRYLPLQRGFDTFYGHGNNGIDYYTHERYGIPSMFRGNDRTQEDKGQYATELFRREALRFVREKSDKPWFLYLCFNAPHGASNFDKSGVQAPEKYVALYKNKGLDEKLARYYAAVTCMDEAIGAVLNAVAERGQTDRTLVLFMSDNGGAGNGGNKPLKGSKGTMWEGGLRVPFLAKWRGTLPAGKTTDALLTTLEIFPTLMMLSGAEHPKGVALDGFDMLPVLQGGPSPRTSMFWQRRSDRAVRFMNWKWVESEKGSGLYDLAKDPGEATNLADANPDVVLKMKENFTIWRKAMDDAEPRGPFRDY